jgi:hypothetical protein
MTRSTSETTMAEPAKLLIPESSQQNEVNKKFIVLVSFVAALGGLLFGFDTAIILWHHSLYQHLFCAG